MGIFKFIKKSMDEEYDLDNLEDLVYEDEPLKEEGDEKDFEDNLANLSMDKLFVGFDIDKNGEKIAKDSDVTGREKNIVNKKTLSKEEEKYDRLLNSVQAQNLIKTVEKMSEKKVKSEETKEKEIEEQLVEGKDSLFIKNGKKRIDFNQEDNLLTDAKKDEEKELLRKIDSSKVDLEVDKLEIDLPDVTKKPKELDKVNTDKFMPSDMEMYVKSQCEIMEEASTFMERAKMEYETVAMYYEDTKKIDEAPTNLRLKVENAAERVENLTTDRRISRGMGNQLPMDVFRRMENLEKEIPEAIDDIRSQEDYYENVKRDMRMLEGERLGLKDEARNLVKRQINIRSFSITSIICMAVIFIVFIFAMIRLEDDANSMLFVTITAVAAMIALALFYLLRKTEREVYVVENKINKATTLLNKVKIKYINAANTLDYQYSKYDVSSSYELAEKFKLFNIMRQEQRHLVEMTAALSAAEKELVELLDKLDLYDSHIWLSQARAILNAKEMVEIRHKLSVRRQKLRTQIEYNDKRVKEAKVNIKNITKRNPEYAKEALKVVENFEKSLSANA